MAFTVAFLMILFYAFAFVLPTAMASDCSSTQSFSPPCFLTDAVTYNSAATCPLCSAIKLNICGGGGGKGGVTFAGNSGGNGACAIVWIFTSNLTASIGSFGHSAATYLPTGDGGGGGGGAASALFSVIDILLVVGGGGGGGDNPGIYGGSGPNGTAAGVNAIFAGGAGTSSNPGSGGLNYGKTPPAFANGTSGSAYRGGMAGYMPICTKNVSGGSSYASLSFPGGISFAGLGCYVGGGGGGGYFGGGGGAGGAASEGGGGAGGSFFSSKVANVSFYAPNLYGIGALSNNVNATSGTILVLDTLFCTAGSKPIFTDVADCTLCPKGFYSNSGDSNCTLCPKGSYSNSGASNCTLCPKGSYSNTGAANCTLCSAGTFASKTGSTSCQQCPGGHYCPAGTSSWARLNCGRGNYCPDGSGAPTSCPYQVPPTGGWGDLQVQGPAFLVETAHCLNHCFWNFTSGDGMLSKC
jgi:hypothetical protein